MGEEILLQIIEGRTTCCAERHTLVGLLKMTLGNWLLPRSLDCYP